MVSGSYYIGDKNIEIQQRKGFEKPFTDFINEIQPERILELGTSYGGLTYFLRSITDVPILSVEWSLNKTHPYVGEIADLVNEHCYTTTFVNDVARPFVSQAGTSLILVDAFPKTWGFYLYSKLLRSGDYIAVHDYFDSWDDFYHNHNNKTWNWCEATQIELQGSIYDNGLEKLDVGLKDYFWGVFKKI